MSSIFHNKKRFKMNDDNTFWGCLGLKMLLALYMIICYIANVVAFIKCDFDAPYKDEIIHLVGILIPPTSGITVWF